MGSGILSVHTGKYLGMDSITTILHGLDGNEVATTRVKEKPITIMTRVQVASDEVKMYEEKYEDTKLGVSRSLQISNGKIISANIYGVLGGNSPSRRVTPRRMPLEMY